MELELEVSESEDFSEFPPEQSVEKCKCQINKLLKKKTSIERKVQTADKATQTVSRKVWRRRKRQELIRRQNASQEDTQSS